MTRHEALKTLKALNAYRRGETGHAEMPNPKLSSEAIDYAIEALTFFCDHPEQECTVQCFSCQITEMRHPHLNPHLKSKAK